MANHVVLVHIAAGSTALIAGAAALSVRKGGRAHRGTGTIFLAAMLVMALTGAIVAALKPERGTAAIGIFTAYLVATSWAAATRRKPGRSIADWVALAVAVCCATAFSTFSVAASLSDSGRLDSLPAAAHYAFAALAWLAAALDLNYAARSSVGLRQRLARHLWRMCAAFLIAAFSFFLGQQKIMPAAIQGSPLLLVPELLILGSLTFWIFRMRFVREIGVTFARRPGIAKCLVTAAGGERDILRGKTCR